MLDYFEYTIEICSIILIEIIEILTTWGAQSPRRGRAQSRAERSNKSFRGQRAQRGESARIDQRGGNARRMWGSARRDGAAARAPRREGGREVLD